MPPQSRDEFEIAIICALPLEAEAVEALFDEHYDELGHKYGKHVGDANSYVTGRINNHDVVLAYMPGMGNRRSASVARGFLVSFPGIKLTLLVGICGGVPYASEDVEIVLGDIIIGDSVIEYDFGRQYPHGFERKRGAKETLGSPNQEIQAFLNRLQGRQLRDQVQKQAAQYLQILQDMDSRAWSYPGVSHDTLFEASYRHKHSQQQSPIECICASRHSIFDSVCEQALKSDCKQVGCVGPLVQRRRLNADSPGPLIHIGTIASASSVMKSGEHRDQLAEKEGVIGFEMEGAGVWDILPCVIIKGVCDYADSHKNKVWQKYAAATAASCAKAFLLYWVNKLQKQRQETSHHPKPFSTIPFERDEMFVGREDIIMSIKDTFQERSGKSSRRAALVGLGGVGKSQIAIEYTYRVQESTPDISTFWVHASNTTRFEQGYRDIATVAKVPGRDDPKSNILQLVNRWLCDEINGKWLMVLDNADDNDTIFNASDQNVPLVDHLPHVSHGSILITSRNQTAARNIVGPSGQLMQVEPMSMHDAMSLLRTRINVDQSDEDDAQLLVQALECIPLAVTQAGAYILNRSSRISVSAYLELFRRSEFNQERLLNYDDTYDLRRDRSSQHPVITTLQISIDRIHHISSKATDLLALMSMFDRQGISEELLKAQMDQLEFEDAVARLISFSLIRTEVRKETFEMHRIVQISMRQWLKQQGELYKWEKESRKIVEEAFPNGDFETWKTCELLRPHLERVLRFAVKSDKDDQLTKTRTTNRYGWYLYLNGKYAEAEALLCQDLEGSEKLLGAKHIDVLESFSKLGLVLDEQGKYEKAEAMHRQALSGYEKVLGSDHPNTLTSANSLGLLLDSQERYKEAEAMYRRAYAGYQKVLGAEHPNTMTSLNNLGMTLDVQGKFIEAEEIHRQTLAARKKVLGAEHPHTLISVNSLGLVLSSQGKLEEAKIMHQHAFITRKKVLGAEHPDTLASIHNLGSVLEKQAKYKEAEAMYRQAFALERHKFGAEHPHTLDSVNHIASILYSQGKYNDAEIMYRQALAIKEKVFGAHDPATLISMHNIALVLHSQGKYEDSEKIYERVLSAENILGAKHINTLTTLNNLGSVLRSQGRFEEAEAMLQQALTGYKQTLRAGHPNIMCCMNNLGLVLNDRGKYDEAEEMHRQTLAAREKVLGAEHPHTLASVHNLGSVFQSQDKSEEAESMYRLALVGRETTLGTEHPDTLDSVSHLGLVLESQEKYEEAEALHRRALIGRENALGTQHPHTLISVSNLGSVLERQGKYEEAEAMHRRVLLTKGKFSP